MKYEYTADIWVKLKRYRNSYPDIVAYHSIAVTLGQAGHMKELFDVMDSMKSLPPNFMNDDFEDWDPRFEPDIVVYNAVRPFFFIFISFR